LGRARGFNWYRFDGVSEFGHWTSLHEALGAQWEPFGFDLALVSEFGHFDR